MAINFNNIGSSGVRDQARAGQAADAGRSDTDPAAPRVQQDRVELSDGARALRSLANDVADLPAVDSARVNDIRRAISEGNYHVDPVRLAQKFLELESDL